MKKRISVEIYKPFNDSMNTIRAISEMLHSAKQQNISEANIYENPYGYQYELQYLNARDGTLAHWHIGTFIY